MMTLSLEPEAHPRREAALAAHRLRGALDVAGLLDQLSECLSDVVDGRPVVRLGQMSAAGADRLAKLVERGLRAERRRRPRQEDGTS